jgi:amino acid permease
MINPDEFLKVMRNVLIIIITILVVFSCFSYEAFGNRIDDMVTMNLPHDNLTSSVQLLYCLGLLGSFPMQVMPAIDITEKTECFRKLPNIL